MITKKDTNLARLKRHKRVRAKISGTAETPRPIIVSKAKVEAVIDEMGKTSAFVAWLNSKAQYFGAWVRGGDEIEYNPMSNRCDLCDLIAALGVSAEQVPELIKSVEA